MVSSQTWGWIASGFLLVSAIEGLLISISLPLFSAMDIVRFVAPDVSGIGLSKDQLKQLLKEARVSIIRVVVHSISCCLNRVLLTFTFCYVV
jgi:hypothetical protein